MRGFSSSLSQNICSLRARTLASGLLVFHVLLLLVASSAPAVAAPCALNPASPSVTICSPTNGATVSNPVTVAAGTTDNAHPVTSMTVYVDNLPGYRTNSDQLITGFSLSAGQHNITVNAWDSSGAVFKSTVIITVAGTGTGPVSVAVTPSSANLAPGAMQLFSATVLNTANTAVQWSVDGFVNGNMTVGIISNGGLYTAPPTAGTHQVVATSVADPTKSDTAIVTVTNSGGGTCSPTSGAPSVTICTPASGATVSSPVFVSAVGTSTTPITKMLVYIDNNLRYQTSTGSVNVSLTVDPGVHNLTVQFFNGTWVIKSQSFAVGTPPPPPGQLGLCSAPQSPGVNVCLPVPPENFMNSPFQVIAQGTGASGKVSLMELWADGKKVNQTMGSRFSSPVTLSTGTHQFTAVELDSNGAFVKSTPFDVIVMGSTTDQCSPPGSPGVNVCMPDVCHTSAWTTILARGTGASGQVSRMELWVNGVKIGDYPGDEIRTNLFVPDFNQITVVEVDSNGNFIKSVPITANSC